MRSVPHLYALAHGVDCVGPHVCLFCTAPCGEQHSAADYLRDSFTGRDSLPCPGSPWVCPGCVLCLRESCAITTHDGKARTGQKVRGYSWVITRRQAIAATKADLAFLRQTCLDPPEPPFAVSLSDSGQKHLLYRGRVCHSRERVIVTLEGERIDYEPGELSARLDLCGRLIAATGKPALAEAPTARFGMAFLERYPDGENDLETWCREWESPLARLAAWLSPGRDDCRNLYPAAATAAVI